MSILSVKDDHGGRIESLYDKLIYIQRMEAAQMNCIYGSGVSVINSYNEMMYVKESYGQDWGKAYYHYIFNPEDNEDIEEESFYEMGVAMAEYIAHFMGHYQVLLSIHFDTQLHMHFITNNIDLDTGERMNLGRGELCALKIGLTEIVRRYHVSPIRIFRPYYILD